MTDRNKGFSSTSSRLMPAREFGVELRRTIRERGIGPMRLAEGLGLEGHTISGWLAGRRLPRLDLGFAVAAYLDNPVLSEIVQEGRTSHCIVCGKATVSSEAGNRKYCDDCRVVRRRTSVKASRQKDRYVSAAAMLNGDPFPLMRELATFKKAVIAMCRSCEGAKEEGAQCHMSDCPLRSVSPLPLAATNLRRLSA